MQPPTAMDTLAELARPTPALTRAGQRDLLRMCEVVQVASRKVKARILEESRHAPCLQSCAADGTPIKVSQQIAAQLPSGRIIRRGGKASHEFLVMSEFVRVSEPSGRTPTCFVVSSPLPLTEGKACDHIVEGFRSRWETLRQGGHRGGAVQHYCFDRCGISKLERLARQWHALISDQFEGKSCWETSLMKESEWVVVTACAAHDMHNAFKWSMSDAFADTDMIRDCFIGVESIRNSFDVILTYLGEWVVYSVPPHRPHGVIQNAPLGTACGKHCAFHRMSSMSSCSWSCDPKTHSCASLATRSIKTWSPRAS